MRRELTKPSLTVFAVGLMLTASVPRPALFFHSHPGGEHAHVHADDDHDHEAIEPDDHDHEHSAHAHVGHPHDHDSHHDGPAFEEAAHDGQLHWHTQSPFQRVVVPQLAIPPCIWTTLSCVAQNFDEIGETPPRRTRARSPPRPSRPSPSI